MLRFAFASAAFVLIPTTASAQEIHIVHCYNGQCPSGAPVTNDLVVREIYALSNNDDRKFADWVAYRVTRETIGTSADLNRGWQTDTFLAEEETVEAGNGAADDYQGAYTAHDYHRGHQAPLAAFAGTGFWRTTNIYSNITPQKGPLNGGAWMRLETAVRDAAYAERELWVVTGPLYERDMPPLDNAGEPHVVPSGYWKVILNEHGDATAFIMDQELPSSAEHCDQRTSLAEVERRSGLSLFPSATVQSGAFDQHLGCRP